MYICQSSSLGWSPHLLTLLGPQVRSPHLCLCFCPENKSISTIFLDSSFGYSLEGLTHQDASVISLVKEGPCVPGWANQTLSPWNGYPKETNIKTEITQRQSKAKTEPWRNCPYVSAPSSPEHLWELSRHAPLASFQNSPHHVQVSQSHQELWLIQEVSNEEMMHGKVPRECKGCIQRQMAFSNTSHTIYYLMISLNGHWTSLMSVPSVLGHDLPETLLTFLVLLDRVTHPFPFTSSYRSQGIESPEHLYHTMAKALSLFSLSLFALLPLFQTLP